nr:unnamed protein product [Callosobruchus chinensis]
MQTMWQVFQEVINLINSSPDTFRYKAVSLPVLWQEVPSEVRYEEAYIYSHWLQTFRLRPLRASVPAKG